MHYRWLLVAVYGWLCCAANITHSYICVIYVICIHCLPVMFGGGAVVGYFRQLLMFPVPAHLLRLMCRSPDSCSQVYISQGEVAMQLRCGGIFRNYFILKFSTECAGEKNLKIGQYLATIGTKVCCLLSGPPCIEFFNLQGVFVDELFSE